MNTIRTTSPAPIQFTRRVMAELMRRYYEWRASHCDSDAAHHDEAVKTYLANAVNSRRHAERFRRKARSIG